MEVDNRAKARRALGDITNSQSNPKSPVALQKLPAQQKELAYLKQIHQKNKIIELAGSELQNLRNCLLLTQQQNQSLAQSNTQMLAELNKEKQKLKEVQHELAITKGLFKMTKLELEELKKVNISTGELPKIAKGTKAVACETGHDEDNIPRKACKRGRPSRSRCEMSIPRSELPMIDKETKVVACETAHDENSVPQKACETAHDENSIPQKACETAHDENNIPRKACKRGRPSRSQSLGVPVVLQPDAEEEAIESKRFCARGKSASLGVPHEEDAFEMDEEKFPELKPSNDPSTKEVVEASDGSQLSDTESKRTSVGRPMRRSAAKVQSYKEKPLNVKMRRPG